MHLLTWTQMLFSVMIVKLIGKILQKQGMDMNDYIRNLSTYKLE